MLSAKLVFPIDGRPAMMTSSLFWNPEVYASSSSNGDGSPDTPPRSESCSRFANLSLMILPIGSNPLRIPLSEISKINRSASSSTSRASSLPWSARVEITPEILTSLRKRKRSNTTRT